MKRLLPFLVALVATVAAAGGCIAAASLSTSAPAGSPLRLRTASMEDLAGEGVQLSTAPQPAQCAITEALPLPDRLGTGILGCPLGVATAATAALRDAGRGEVVESVLALVSWSNGSGRVSGRLAWVVVVYGGAAIVAGPGACAAPPCPLPSPLELLQDRVVVVDAHSGAVLTAVTVSPAPVAPTALAS